MIDLGLAKLAMIGAVALIVIGPEKLPKVARMAGSLLGRAQRYMNQVKAEVSREMELDELRKMQKSIEETASDLKSDVSNEMSGIGQSISSAWQDPVTETFRPLPEQANIARKAKAFRQKKLLRNSALPGWFLKQQGSRSRLLSASARVAKYRPKPASN